MKLTITKVAHMHRRCSDSECPVCCYGWKPSAEKNARVTAFLRERGLTVVTEGGASPYWHVKESAPQCYTALRGNPKPKA